MKNAILYLRDGSVIDGTRIENCTFVFTSTDRITIMHCTIDRCKALVDGVMYDDLLDYLLLDGATINVGM